MLQYVEVFVLFGSVLFKTIDINNIQVVKKIQRNGGQLIFINTYYMSHHVMGYKNSDFHTYFSHYSLT